MEMEDPKYRHLEQQIREKDDEVENLHKFNSELDSKLQKLLTEFSQFRSKAHQMLSSKEDELEKLKGRSGNNTSSISSHQSPQFKRKTSNTDGYESNFDSNQSKVQGNGQISLPPLGPTQAEKTTVDYIKNVFIKYLEYQANTNEKEAQTLEKVLFTVLKATEKDIEIIEKARSKNHSGGILSYFYTSSQPLNLVPRPLQPRAVDSILNTNAGVKGDVNPGKQRRASYHGQHEAGGWSKQGSGEKSLKNVTIDESPQSVTKHNNKGLFSINVTREQQ